MFTTLRTKLLVGLAPLLAIIVVLGVWAVIMFTRLGGDIDVILRENYRSVLACQNLKEALERMDSAALFAIGGRDERAKVQYRESLPRFIEGLETERGNVTLVGEQKLVDDLTQNAKLYLDLSQRFYETNLDTAARADLYFRELLPTFTAIKEFADSIQSLNQRNMEAENDSARRAASRAARIMVVVLIGSAILATAIALVLSRSILEPIGLVTQAVRSMSSGNYDQVVPATTRDELGELASTFNAMARRIREFQQAGTVRLIRAQKTAQATIDSFPDPVVVVDLQGSVERSNPAATRLLNVSPSSIAVPWNSPSEVQPCLEGVLGGGPDCLPTSLDKALCLRDEGQEKFYLPRVIAIRGDDGLLGAAVVLQDVTKFRLVDQLKSDMVATVSHELKTPLTSLQMAVHLLLEEAVGSLNAKQTELLVAARQDAERLLNMVNDLLDLARIEQGRVRLDLRPVAPAELIAEAAERFRTTSIDLGLEIRSKVDGELPRVSVDRDRIGHVFENLIGNALFHTPRGGVIDISAEREGDAVLFTVADSGRGIPDEHLPRIFDKFYRVNEDRSDGGAGLGLAIAREIVEAHRGSIGVQSRIDEGTRFSVRLPISHEFEGH